MQSIQQGDADSLARLYDESAALVFSIALRILNDPADAEEVTLDVFTQVWRNSGSWDSSRGTVTSWLILLARSRALDRLRWRNSRTRFEELRENWEKTAQALSQPIDGSELAHRREQVSRALDTLSAPQRAVLDLAFFGGYTQQEIADRLQEPLGTIKSRIRSALAKLKEVLR